MRTHFRLLIEKFTIRNRLTFKQRRLIIKVIQRIKKQRQNLLQNHEPWLIYSTLLVVIIAAVVLVGKGMPDRANEVGDFLAGFAGALAFLWLIASFRMQGKELAMQRAELSLQREEFSRISQYSALEHVKTMVEEFLKDLNNHPANTENVGAVKHPSDLINISNILLSPENPIFTAQTEGAVKDAYREYELYKIAEYSFINSYIAAAKFFVKNIENISEDDPDTIFLVNYGKLLKNTPYLSNHFETVFYLTHSNQADQLTNRLIRHTGMLVSKGLLARASISREIIQRDVEEQMKRKHPVPNFLLSYLNKESRPT